MKRMKMISIIALVISMLFTGCAPTVKQTTGSSSADVPVIKFGFYGGQVEEQAYQACLKGAEEKFGVKIQWVRYPDTASLWNNLPSQMASKSAPDILSVTNENYLEFVDKGMFLNIAPYITQKDFDFSRVANVHKCWQVNGGIYGIPSDGAPAAFIVNMDMWNKAGLGELPKTMDDVYKAAKVLTKGNVKGIVTNDMEFHFTQYVLAFGGGWGAGKTIDTPENAQGLQFIIDLHRAGLSVTPKELGLGWDGEVFAKGLAAMSTGGVWYVATLKEMAPNMHYKIIPMPKGTVNGCTAHSDANVVISSTKYPELAAKICAYMARDEAQIAISDLYGNPPAYKDLQDAFFKKNKEIAVLQPAFEYAQTFGYPSETKKFTDALSKEMDEALYDKNSTKTAKEVLANVAKEFPTK